MSALSVPRSERIELICFAALGVLASLQWVSLVADPPAARVLLAVALATAAGAGLAAIARLPNPRATRWALAAAAALIAVCLGLVIVGLPARLLLPSHWGELLTNVDRSLTGLTDVPIPYAGADVWTRLVILLAAPLTVAAAAFAAFWPTRRRAAGRIWALGLLVGLYLTAVAWAEPDSQLAGGVLLLLLVFAWLWLPSTGRVRGPAAGLAVAIALLVAVPAAALVDPGRSLIDYRHWSLFSAQGLSFSWDQSYGPLDWPQKGTLMLEVESDQQHYWKATNLDTFDGVRWERSGRSNPEPALGEPFEFVLGETAPRPNPEWVERINLEARRLTSDFAIGAGTTLALRRAEASPNADGTWSMSEELEPGDSYSALVYDPKPSAEEMRAAGTAYPTELARYASFTLTGGEDGARSIDAPLWGASGPPSIQDEVQGTPYEEMHALALGLAAGAPTPYDAVRRIELHLRSTYEYRQDVPNSTYPLPSFISEDRAGYCQQFSGAMALMLRMIGIPSRVATGFAPGGRDQDRNAYLVDDTDAHNWVEVFFPGIGWTTFEPTPAAAPAETSIEDSTVGGSDPEQSPGDEGAVTVAPDAQPGELPVPAPQPGVSAETGGGSSGSGIAAMLGAGAGAVALAALGAYAFRARRRSRFEPDELAEAELRELDRALAKLGSPLAPGTTLRGAQKELARLAGPTAARYAAGLEARRYRDPSADPPGVGERRQLRRAVRKAAGPRSALLALPPGGPAIRRTAGVDRKSSPSRAGRPPSAGPSAAPG
jgi:protein-glutamine gamma-glutamyltransferase